MGFLLILWKLFDMNKKKQDRGRLDNKSNTGGRSKDAGRQEMENAHRQADQDISADPEFSAHSPNDDLDEGETARLGEFNTGLI
jgi:hypothetical protein